MFRYHRVHVVDVYVPMTYSQGCDIQIQYHFGNLERYYACLWWYVNPYHNAPSFIYQLQLRRSVFRFWVCTPSCRYEY